MIELNNIVRLLNKELNVKNIPDSSKNGLQVNCKNKIKRIGFAVDACLSTFEKAKKAKVDLLIVHHGIKWKPQKYRELTKKREEYLKKNKISLYAAHLPLDAHNKYGNNIGLSNILNLINIKKFGKYHGYSIGYQGELKKSISLTQIKSILNKELKTECDVLKFGKKQIKNIGIVSGGGSDAIEEATKKQLDCFILGETTLGAYHRAKDYKLNIIIAGHYATEIVGVKLLMPFIEKKFKVQTIFIDNPTGI